MSIQRQIPIEGTLAACPTCRKQPKHYVTLGKELHHLECPPCGTRTPKFSTFGAAVEKWESAETVHYERAA
jgi:Zn ribbon nucleic-acid-binding protein